MKPFPFSVGYFSAKAWGIHYSLNLKLSPSWRKEEDLQFTNIYEHEPGVPGS